MRWVGWLVSLLKFVVAGLVSLLLLAGWAAAVALPWVLLQGRADVPAWVPCAAAGAVFPVVPLLWHLVGERRVRARASLRGRDRFVLRSLAVAMLSTAVATVVAPSAVAVQWARVREVASAYLPAEVLAWSQRAGGPRELVTLAPQDAAWVVVADLSRMEPLSIEEDDVAFPKEDRCGVDLSKAKMMLAFGDWTKSTDPAIFVAVRADGIADPSVVACLWSAVVETAEDPLKFQLGEEGGDGWRTITVHDRERGETIDAELGVLDANTVGFVSTSWKPGVVQALGGGRSAQDGRLAAPLARIDQTTPFWGAIAAEVEGVDVVAGGSIELDENTFRWAASADPGQTEEARALESDLREVAGLVKKWGSATSWVPGDYGERWTADLAVRREGTVVYGDFVVGHSMATRAGKLMFFSW